MSKRKQFFSLNAPRDVADILDVEYSRLIYHIFKIPDDEKYETYYVTKRDGSTREISAPVTALKMIQQKLNLVLQEVYVPKAPAHAYLPGKSIVSNAAMHTKQRFILNIDLQDFFPSITLKRVRGLFQAVPYERNLSVALILARICCYGNRLPQGAPTSPIISNMICAKMDSQLRRLAVKHRCKYTRYADDLTFSTSLSRFPTALAELTPEKTDVRLRIGPELTAIIENNGFRINNKKVRLQTSDRRQVVTGLVVNRYVNVQQSFLKEIRAMLHSWQKFGYENAEQVFHAQYDQRNRNADRDMVPFAAVVRGKIEFVGMVRGKDDPVYLRFLLALKELDPNLVKQTKLDILKGLAYLTHMRDVVAKKYNDDEFRTLCFDLDVKYDDLPAATITGRARELVEYMRRHDRIWDLEAKVRKDRPGAL